MLKLKKYPKRSPYWCVRGTVAGISIFESTGTSDRAQAEAYRIKKEKEVFDRGALGIQAPTKFADAMTAYLQNGGSPRFLDALLDHFKETPINEIGQLEVNEAAAAIYPDAGPATRVRQVYGPVAAILNDAARLKLPGAAFVRFAKPAIPKTPVKRATWEHSEQLMAASSPQVRAWILVSSATGLRASEMIRQRPPDYRVRPKWVDIGTTKNGEPAMVPLTDTAWEAVQAIMPSDDSAPVFGYLTVQGVNAALRRAAKRAGLPHLSTHKIGRHTFAGRILDARHSLKTLKEAGRWKKMQVVDETYGHMEISIVHDIMVEVAEGKKK